MRNKRLLAPGFLNTLDEWLLLNKPETWSARTHLVAYYGGLFIFVLGMLVFIFPDDPRTETGWANWSLFTTIITLIALVVWLIYLLRFNVFKRYGISTAADRLKTFLLYLLATGIIMVIPFVQPLVESAKANAMYGDEELVKDVNEYNTMIAQLEYPNLRHAWSRDTVTVRDTLPGHSQMNAPSRDDGNVTVYHDTIMVAPPPPKPGLIDTAAFNAKLKMADSVLQMNDSMYIFLDCPDYVFLDGYNVDRYTDGKLMTSLDMYRQVISNYRPPDRGALSSKVNGIMEKYYYHGHTHEYHDYSEETIDKRYKIDNIRTSLWHILERKQRWRGESLQVISRVFFYLTLITALLVFVFRHSTVKTFFLTLLAAAVISILNALFIALSGIFFTSFFVILLVWFGIFTICSIVVWSARVRSIWLGIGSNLFVLMVPFLPLIITGFYYALEEERQRLTGTYEEHPDMALWFGLSEIAGIVLLLVLIPTYIHRLYRKWFALPED